MKKLFFLIAVVGMASTVKARSNGGGNHIPGLMESNVTAGGTLIVKCVGDRDVCCIILSRSMTEPGTLTVARKTYTFSSWTNEKAPNGDATLTFKDAVLQ